MKGDGSLNDVDCGEKVINIGYICTKPKSQIFLTKEKYSFLNLKVNVPCTDSTKQANCPQGWIEPGSTITDVPSCYFFSPKGGTMTWYDQKRACQNQDGDLAVLENSLELTWVNNKIIEILKTDYYCWALNWHRS